MKYVVYPTSCNCGGRFALYEIGDNAEVSCGCVCHNTSRLMNISINDKKLASFIGWLNGVKGIKAFFIGEAFDTICLDIVFDTRWGKVLERVSNRLEMQEFEEFKKIVNGAILHDYEEVYAFAVPLKVFV